MRQPIPGAAKQRQRITEIEAHCFAPAGNGSMNRALWISGQLTHYGSDRIGNRLVISGAANVIEQPAFSAAQNVKGIQREPDFRQTVILPQSVKTSPDRR